LQKNEGHRFRKRRASFLKTKGVVCEKEGHRLRGAVFLRRHFLAESRGIPLPNLRYFPRKKATGMRKVRDLRPFFRRHTVNKI